MKSLEELKRTQNTQTVLVSPVMLEKAIVALQLLAHIAETDLPIQFKGGTSLLLRLRRAP